MIIFCQTVAGLTYVRLPMKSGRPREKVSVETTKNDNMQNRLEHHRFLADSFHPTDRLPRRTAGHRTAAPGWCRAGLTR